MNTDTDGQMKRSKGFDWTSRKLWFFVVSLAIGAGAAYLDRLDYPLVALLCVLPTIYGIVNVAVKKISRDAVTFEPTDGDENDENA